MTLTCFKSNETLYVRNRKDITSTQHMEYIGRFCQMAALNIRNDLERSPEVIKHQVVPWRTYDFGIVDHCSYY